MKKTICFLFLWIAFSINLTFILFVTTANLWPESAGAWLEEYLIENSKNIDDAFQIVIMVYFIISLLPSAIVSFLCVKFLRFHRGGASANK